MILVFAQLDPEDIVSSVSVSKLWNAFHINFNWKNAFMTTFGELSSSAVDLSQKINWRQIFFDRKRFSLLCHRKVYKPKPLLPSQTIVRTISFTKDHIVYYGTTNSEIHSFDLQIFKKDPNAKEKGNVPACTLKSLQAGYAGPVKGDSQGVMCIYGHLKSEDPGSPNTQIRCFWNIKKGTKSLPCIKPSLLKTSPYGDGTVFMNSKYILYARQPHFYLFDVAKRCNHLCNLEKRGNSYELEQASAQCVGQSCAIVDYMLETYYTPFLSEVDPDLHVAISSNKDNYYELILWCIGGEKTVISIAPVVDSWRNYTKILSEHVTKTVRKKIAHHWLSFQLNNELYFIDLKDTSKKIKMALVPHNWIPNENKVALRKKEKLIIFDLERASWVSKLVFPSHIVDVSVLDNGKLIAVLGLHGEITICHWQTAAQSKSIHFNQTSRITAIVLLAEDLLLIQANKIYYVHL